MKIIIGAVISIPPYSAGMAWNWMQHAVGLRQLGHEVYYLEEVKPEWCVDARGEACDFVRSLNRVLFQSTMERFGLMERASQIYNHGEAAVGLPYDSVIAVAREADLLINISGHIKDESILGNVGRRVYVDQDPVYSQLWAAEYGKDPNFKLHDIFFSVGLNIGTPHTSIPDCGIRWYHTLPPVVPEKWRFHIDASCARFTTIASWGGYSDLHYEGGWYRSKDEEFRRFAELPGRTRQAMEVALKKYPQVRVRVQFLRDNGWILTDAARLATPSDYQDYISCSRAEIGIAKNAYVKGNSGWFSDRSAHYLASGRPVLAQSTGFERCLPTGRGLLTFRSMEEAVAGIDEINRDYEAHCRAAREFAHEYLDYRKVLPRMLEACTNSRH